MKTNVKSESFSQGFFAKGAANSTKKVQQHAINLEERTKAKKICLICDKNAS
jgi:hypothetical protein